MKMTRKVLTSFAALMALVLTVGVVGLYGCGNCDDDDDGSGSKRLAGNHLFVMVAPDSGIGPDSVSAYKVSADGALEEINASPFATGGQSGANVASIGMAATSNIKFLFVGHNGSSSIEVFKIMRYGKLTAVSGSPFATASNPVHIEVHPSDDFLFVATANEVIEVFEINRSSGELTAVTGSPFTVGTSVRGFAIHPDGAYLYTGHMFGADEGLQTYAIDQDTGAITFLASTTLPGVGRPGGDVVINPAGDRLFCSDLDNQIYVADINPATGGLTLVSSTPKNVGVFVSTMILNRAGDRLYFSDNTDIYGFDVTAAGDLTALANSPYQNIGNQLYAMDIDQDDGFLFAGSRYDDQIHVMEILDGGSLEEVSASPFADANAAGVPAKVIALP
jgi:6-phosphogluconolactonase (cycloisomerase 2 family)